MQPYDILMLVVLVGATLFGFWKGMAWQIASLASLVLSALAAIHFSGRLAPVFGEQSPWNRYIAMLVIYMVTALAIWLVFRLVANIIDRVRLKEFDRQIGAIFGMAKGVLLCIVITFFVVTLSESARQIVLGTQSGRYIALLIKNATPVLPEEITNHLGEYIQKLDDKLDPDTPADLPPNETLSGLSDADLNNVGKSMIDDLKAGLKREGTRLRDDLDKKLDEKLD